MKVDWLSVELNIYRFNCIEYKIKKKTKDILNV